MANQIDILNFVENLAISPYVDSFYPYTICRTYDLPLEDVLDSLNAMIQLGLLDLKYEIRCDNDANILEIVDKYSNYLGRKYYCYECNEEIEISIENVCPIFYITEKYKENMKKKKYKDSWSRRRAIWGC